MSGEEIPQILDACREFSKEDRSPDMKPMPHRIAQDASRKVFISLRNGMGGRAIAGVISDVNAFKDDGNEIRTANEMALEDAIDNKRLVGLLEENLFAETVGDLKGLKLVELQNINGVTSRHIRAVRKCMRRYGLRLLDW